MITLANFVLNVRFYSLLQMAEMEIIGFDVHFSSGTKKCTVISSRFEQTNAAANHMNKHTSSCLVAEI